MSDKTIEVTQDNFEAEVLNSDTPVLVDFWAEWCGPCKAIAPIVDELAEDYSGKLKIGKLDADAHQEVLMRYQVMGIPTLILFKQGEPVARITGFKAKEKIVKELVPHIG
ncbi:MAG: thioredoxin [Anaerolineae bacterium]|jgi:thioredoxin 1|nr:thioredoxin [Anaerolineae bacterium]